MKFVRCREIESDEVNLLIPVKEITVVLPEFKDAAVDCFSDKRGITYEVTSESGKIRDAIYTIDEMGS